MQNISVFPPGKSCFPPGEEWNNTRAKARQPGGKRPPPYRKALATDRTRACHQPGDALSPRCAPISIVLMEAPVSERKV